MNQKLYVGITIGPIIETMSYTSTPAGLWTASYFFSEITVSLYQKLNDNHYDVITVPKDVQKYRMDGIGQFHDRIYAVVPDGITKDEAQKIVQESIHRVIEEKAQQLCNAISDEKTATILEDCRKGLEAYLQIHYVVMEIGENQVLAQILAGALDALENCQSIVGNLTQNPLIRLVSGKRNNSNCYIKRYEPFKKATWFKGDNESIKDLETLFPGQNYFAIVQADGDGMGKIVNAELDNDEDAALDTQEKRIRMFSELCMNYTGEAARIIQDYNGIVIYAGGDDLLFLAPVVNVKGENIWKLCQRIATKFNEIFDPGQNDKAKAIVQSDKIPSISFGVSINHYKFPLYEAFEDGRNLLFGKAKSYGNKNNFAIALHKASGQSSGYVCCMETRQKTNDTMFNKIIEYQDMISKNDAADCNQMLHSMLYHIENQKALYRIAVTDEQKRTKFFENVFDSSMQKNCEGYINKVNELAGNVLNAKAIIPLQDSDEDVLTSILRTSKFLVEERG